MQPGTLTELTSKVRRMVPGQRILLFGSSSLLASFPAEPPARIGVELTLDADFLLDPDDAGSREKLSDAPGRNRPYHITHGYYGDFVDLRMSEAFPEGWCDRLVPMPEF